MQRTDTIIIIQSNDKSVFIIHPPLSCRVTRLTTWHKGGTGASIGSSQPSQRPEPVDN
jgi:hypothetical protein